MKGVNKMDYIFNRDTFLKLTNQEILDLLNSITKFDLYSLSTGWRESAEFILKGKGAKGDVIIGWN